MNKELIRSDKSLKVYAWNKTLLCDDIKKKRQDLKMQLSNKLKK